MDGFKKKKKAEIFLNDVKFLKKIILTYRTKGSLEERESLFEFNNKAVMIALS
jgi:hypothetical protein